MPGETVFVRGPSGGGKSTLLSLAAGVLTASSGSVALLGKSWQAMPAAQRDRIRGDHIGYIFQQFNLLPYLSALDNVLLTCQLSHVRPACARRRRCCGESDSMRPNGDVVRRNCRWDSSSASPRRAR